MLYTYSIMPLDEEHFDEICADVRDQYERGISSCPMFKLTLVPEGDPVWDKIGPACKVYRRFREALAPDGIKTGILIQASLGHAYAITPNPFRKYLNLDSGNEQFVCCPADEGFLDHFSDVCRQIAAEHPDAIMLDDDFRMGVRPGRGCACSYHMQEFNRRAGTNMTREELYAHIMSHPESDRLTNIFLDTQRDSLVAAATRFREAIDSEDPTIQGINCTSGDACDFVADYCKIFAGKGNPSIVRCANGTYSPLSVRRFSDIMRTAAVRGGKLKNHGVDIVLAETDTVPFNRYAKSARYLHAHYAYSMLEGLKGAKHWITRLSAHEPNSGKAFRDILAKHAKMYEELARISDELSWVGCGSAFIEQSRPRFHNENFRYWHENEWIASNIERMGLPFYYTDKAGKALFVEQTVVADMSDEQIETLFEGSVFVDGDSAHLLCERGYGDRLGVLPTDWDKGPISGEYFADKTDCICSSQKRARVLTPTKEGVRELSYNFKWNDGNKNILAPAVTAYEREAGKLSVVYCGVPKADFKYTEGFAFLNETRKEQFVSLLKEAGALPVYCVGDDEVCLRAGTLADGSLFVSAVMLGYDPMDAMTLYLEKAPKAARLLLPDGTYVPVAFEKVGEDTYVFDARVEPMYPAFMVIESFCGAFT